MLRKMFFGAVVSSLLLSQCILFAADVSSLTNAKPVIIGISGLVQKDNDWSNYNYSSIDECYVNAVLKAGGVPVIIPVNENSEAIKEQIKLVDGLILTGGEDINPQMYNQEPRNSLGEIAPRRDAFDKMLLNEATSQKKPVLGICRGNQFINVSFNGTLYQDIPSEAKDNFVKHRQDSEWQEGSHKIDIVKGSWIATVLGKDEVLVNSYHHQAVKDLAPGFKITAYSKDGIVEGIEKENGSFCVGVQWHPEMMAGKSPLMLKIFQAFIEVCREK